MKNPWALQVGQKLWYVPSGIRRRGDPEEIEVTKIGRKWATVGEGWQKLRIDLETLWADGGECTSPGSCYLSKKDYEDKVLLSHAWDRLRRYVERSYSVPEGFTLNTVQRLSEEFGLDEKGLSG